MTEKKINLVEQFVKYATRSIGEEGCYPQPGMTLDKDGGMNVYALAVAGPTAFGQMESQCNPTTEEMIFGIDTFTKPGQGTTYDDCLIIFHSVRGEKTRIGVLEYRWNGGDVQTKPINWENEFWNQMYEKYARRLDLPKVTIN